ncbi:hypothetical protein Flavo103_45670 [Flavobacterium collinsii]|jgi:hypothetical protein|uniref:hypothetical protein n=1 Tax=Flavobacterium collinsii TaxID=1114861 RepID=UPI0022CB13DD|nr:hypothetical protein [Flavobacterium collinsii]GIQ61432.1 hypothetical protein Flavo103_45670 [Flavobacterium collinsii]
MKLMFCFFILLIPSSFLNYQKNEIDNYKNAISLILHSTEYKKYGSSNKNYNVSSEVVSFSNFSRFFKEELSKDVVNEIVVNEIVKQDLDLLKLNVRRCGKVKVFFSEEKENIFFAEVFISKNKDIKYKDRPLFGMSKVYMFKIRDEETSLVAIKELHYN